MAEDNLADALLVREAIRLENLPLDVFALTDGETAIEFLERAETDANAPQPDLVFLDLNLPRIGGFDVLRRIRSSAKFSNLPVMIMTSSDSPGDRREGSELGASYVCKPPGYEEFLRMGAAIRSLLEEKNLA